MSNLFKKTIACGAIIMIAGISCGTMIAIPDIVDYHRRKLNIKHQEKVNDQRAEMYKSLLKMGMDHEKGRTLTMDTYQSDEDVK